MIKRSVVLDRNNPAKLIDALATAMGYTREGDAYVPATKIEKKPTPRKPYAKRKHVKLPPDFYEALKRMEVGEEYDVTDEVRDYKLDSENLKSRIYQFGYVQRLAGNQVKYKAYKTGSEYRVVRVS